MLTKYIGIGQPVYYGSNAARIFRTNRAPSVKTGIHAPFLDLITPNGVIIEKCSIADISDIDVPGLSSLRCAEKSYGNCAYNGNSDLIQLFDDDKIATMMENSKQKSDSPHIYNKTEVSRIEPHVNFEGNRVDAYYYQFCVNHSLSGIPRSLLESAISAAIQEAINKSKDVI